MKYHVAFDIDFKRNPYMGKYIALEGIDGCGKTTQVAALKETLEKSGKTVVTRHEPTRKGPIGELIHKVLQAREKISPVSLQYLFSADRAVLQATVIDALRKGKIVISDRCFWSSIPYGLADRESLDYSNEGEVLTVAYSLLSFYHQFMVPDYTFYLDISIDKALIRLSAMHKTQEIYEKKEKLEKIAKGYQWLLKKFPKEITVVNGKQPVESATKEILHKLLM